MNKQCSICYDDIVDCTVTPCGHTFCYDCIAEWVRRTENCPICKSRVTLNSLIRVNKNRNVQTNAETAASTNTQAYFNMAKCLEKQTKKRVIDEVSKVIDSITITKNDTCPPKAIFSVVRNPSAITVYGSYKTNLSFPFSDVDMSLGGYFLQFPPDVIFPIISDALTNTCVCTTVLQLPYARVPLLKLRSSQDGIDVDISMENTMGIETTKLVGRLCHQNVMLRPLVILVRYLLHQGGFTSVISGGLNTFMITLMVYSFLDMYNTGKFTGGKPDTDLGSVFVTFLQHFGYDFDYTRYGISIGKPCSYFEKESRGWIDYSKPMVLTIENPLDNDINLTPNTFLTPLIKDYFAKCLQWILPSNGDDIYYFIPKKSRLARVVFLPDEMLNRS
ncbi:hypothetical protein EIN_344850 [Entamoeba invadens IP1]|uniref:RING-type domain-containing protein n=1 Tax=Entamoeba invadens IP1 TaxID=370355 RepID=A0A0A1U6R6_ENTIV|nr:hypothetical protein EIN_344850 [Entamoeba invadens IP1]ELP88525.1 hypothetical protein EIN_344850 [Entamoeba invadens IP1]|eukprot:XP_004255296.1 hypothetical protein EIN_344850 [Entamoeba invadens IP1]